MKWKSHAIEFSGLFGVLWVHMAWYKNCVKKKFMTLKSGMKARVSLETTIEPHDLVYYTNPHISGDRQKSYR